MASTDIDASFHSLVDQDEVNYKVVKQLNSQFGRDIKTLSKVTTLVEDLTTAREQLEKRLRFATTEAPDKITKAVKAAEIALSQEAQILNECNKLKEDVEMHLQKVSPLLEVIGPGVREVGELERVKAYNQWVQAVEEQSSEIESSLHMGAEGQAMLGYGRLYDSAEVAQTTQCTHLLNFITKTLQHWHHVFTLRFTSEFESVLKVIKWPFTTSKLNQPPPPAESLQRLETLTHYLLQLSLPPEIASIHQKETINAHTPAILADFPSLLLPLHLLLRPLEVRFVYHFSGNKATNSRENPEWYFTQVLKWISAHEDFLNKRIQPILRRCGHDKVNAKIEIMRGLVRLVVLKLSQDLPDVQYDDDLFCTTVQETLNFERELSIAYNYPASQPSVLTVLTQARNFARWIHIERKFALEVMDELVSGKNAWEVVEGGETAHCGEHLILLLQGINDRYKRLPQPGHRLQFLELQLEILDDFRVRILQMTKSERQNPLESNYGSILNTVHHIGATLNDWADMPFYVEMQYYREQFSNIHEQQKMVTVAASNTQTNTTSSDDLSTFSPFAQDMLNTSVAPDATLARMDAFDTLNVHTEVPSTEQLSEITGSVFDEIVQKYTYIEKDMVKNLASYVFTEVRARSQPYRRDKWFNTNNEVISVTEPSPSICPLFEVLVRHLHALRDVLATRLFTQLWKLVAEELNKHIYEEVVLQNHFSEAGAAQLKFDMTRGLFPIFGEFTQKPENYFKEVKESVILLTLPRPTGILLRETFRMYRQDQETFSHVGVSPVKALAEHGITLLTPEKADTVLNIRTKMGMI
ncbi:unnamed protein product [Meganyctiphanes norvegica]|uniref:RAD50-interacting protein 1 n=1 Tax=Meganyctiphanes norvegica TaxID=48144 RepID=A0AAV2QPC7_MEGNR